MKYLFIDNDILINLATGSYDDNDEILTQLERLINERKVSLVVPEVLRIEWDRNKQPKVIDAYEKSQKQKVKNLKDLIPYLNKDLSEKVDLLVNDLNNYGQVYRAAAADRVKKIEQLLEHSRTHRLPTIPDVQRLASDLALQGKRPFTSTKNSMGDALNFLTCVEYLRGQEKTLYFVTNNKNDFSNNRNHNELHPDLQEIANGVDLQYRINIGQALNEIESEAITEETVQKIENIERMGLNRYGIPYVQICDCGNKMDDRTGMWINGTWYLKCINCGVLYNTGEHFD